MKRTLTVGLLWHSVNSGNLGVGALTVANIALIRRRAAAMGLDVSFIVIGWQDARDPYVAAPDVTMFPFRPRQHLKRPGALIGAIRRCDVVFDIGAGDSFSDLYGSRRFFYLAAAKVLVLALGRPLVLSPQTIGPYRQTWVRGLAARILRRAQAVVVRDRLSLECLRELGLGRNCHEATDVAFELPGGQPPLASSQKIRVGINVSGLIYNGGGETARNLGLVVDYPALMEDVIGRFSRLEGCEVHLIGHVFSDHPVDDDRKAIERLANRFPGVVAAPEFTSPTEAKAYIGAMDFFTGARMHACIAAFSSGVPVIPVSYSRKFTGLFGSLGYDAVADCRRDREARVSALIMQGFEQRDRLSQQIRKGMERVQAKLDVYDAVIADGLKAAAQGSRERAPVSQAA